MKLKNKMSIYIDLMEEEIYYNKEYKEELSIYLKKELNQILLSENKSFLYHDLFVRLFLDFYYIDESILSRISVCILRYLTEMMGLKIRRDFMMNNKF